MDYVLVRIQDGTDVRHGTGEGGHEGTYEYMVSSLNPWW